MRAAEAHRDAETLSRAHRDVEAHRARLLQQRQRQQVGCHDRQGACLVQGFAPPGVIPQLPERPGIAKDCAE